MSSALDPEIYTQIAICSEPGTAPPAPNTKLAYVHMQGPPEAHHIAAEWNMDQRRALRNTNIVRHVLTFGEATAFVKVNQQFEETCLSESQAKAALSG